jgi:hypothetical protein
MAPEVQHSLRSPSVSTVPKYLNSVQIFTFCICKIHYNIVTCYLRSQPIRGSLLGNRFVSTNNTGAVARQQPARNNGSTVGSGAFYVVRPEAISLHRQSSKEFSEFQIRSSVQLLASRRPGKEHQCNQWSETRTTGAVIVVTVTVIVKVSANKANIF